MTDMAGAAEIPATRFFSRSPQGLNATGESDLRNYYEKIAQLQETMLRSAPVMFVSTLGFLSDDYSGSRYPRTGINKSLHRIIEEFSTRQTSYLDIPVWRSRRGFGAN